MKKSSLSFGSHIFSTFIQRGIFTVSKKITRLKRKDLHLYKQTPENTFSHLTHSLAKS